MVFVKGKSGNPAGKPKGAKNGTTLLREERRAMFDQWASDNWLATMKNLRAEYVADQFLGPVTQKHEVEANIKQTTIPPEAIAIIEEDIEKKLTDES